MKTERAALIAVLMLFCVMFVMDSAEAQSPSSAPTTSTPVGQIPENVPPNWKANGWDQSSWTAFRENCRAIFAHPGKYPHQQWVTCANVSVAFSSLPEPPSTPSLQPSDAAPGSPTPLPTPLPPISQPALDLPTRQHLVLQPWAPISRVEVDPLVPGLAPLLVFKRRRSPWTSLPTSPALRTLR